MPKIDEIRDMTKALGGIFHEFNQSYAQIKSARTIPGLFTSDKQNLAGNGAELYVGGMCHIMSAFWIVGQVSGLGPKKQGFIEWVVPGGNTNAVNMQAVSVLVAKTVMYKAKGDKASSLGILKDPNFDDTFFAIHNIRNKREEYDGFYGIYKAVGRRKDRFYMISYKRNGGGHACAAQSTSEGGYAYFDPNYGQAILPGRKLWERWYEEYLTISTYDTKYTAGQSAQGYKGKGSD